MFSACVEPRLNGIDIRLAGAVRATRATPAQGHGTIGHERMDARRHLLSRACRVSPTDRVVIQHAHVGQEEGLGSDSAGRMAGLTGRRKDGLDGLVPGIATTADVVLIGLSVAIVVLAVASFRRWRTGPPLLVCATGLVAAGSTGGLASLGCAGCATTTDATFVRLPVAIVILAVTRLSRGRAGAEGTVDTNLNPSRVALGKAWLGRARLTKNSSKARTTR